ncbi:ribonuclease E/G [Salipaludibacillus keqinensis]|uniref:Ribonuclease E/G n=1 Tax=Salipaludibacillus keqinensis TaxID=2045207 RepID=A0A323TVQ9_9BACI|nr:Rne/Rng family ribonuclease [Salipaludibacillus keqinensis]PYZ93615.1 ribonuclease E/G [Salipaludibacillus keqinensis]
MDRKIILHRWMNDMRGALLEEGKVVEWLFDTPSEGPQPGMIFRGQVVDVLPGMDAVFVDIGAEKNGFLYKKELVSYHRSINEADGSGAEKPISSYMTKGQWINVQVKKEETGSKGAKLTELLSFPGKYLVYLPEANYVAVSKKMNDEVRDEWRAQAREWLENDEGIIIRTVAEDRSSEEVYEELSRLKDTYQEVLSIGKQTSKKTMMLYNDSSLMDRVIRDFLDDENTMVVVDQLDDYQYIKKHEHKQSLSKVELYRGKEDIFTHYDLHKTMEKSLKPFIWMKNGGSLQIDHTEAMTVIDVNSAKFIGKQGLRETALKLNVEAAKTIADQLRLRDVGGIVLIDFVDMSSDEDRAEVLKVLRNQLKKDRTMTSVLGFTKLGLVEMTRKKTRKTLQESLLRSCSVCDGTGKVLKEEEIAREMEIAISSLRNLEEDAVLIEVAEKVYTLYKTEARSRLARIEEQSGKEIYLNKSNTNTFTIRIIGSVEEVRKRWEGQG